MLTVRLPKDLETKLKAQAKAEKLGKSELVKRAIREYIDQREKKLSSYELGKDLFGCMENGPGNLSKNYKKILTESLRAKYHH